MGGEPDSQKLHLLTEMPPRNSQEGIIIIPGHNELPEQILTSDIRSMWASVKADIHKIRVDMEQDISRIIPNSKGTDKERCMWSIKIKWSLYTSEQIHHELALGLAYYMYENVWAT